MIRYIALLLVFGVIAGCKNPPAPGGAAAARGAPVVTINDTVISEVDVALMRGTMERGMTNPHQPENAAEAALKERMILENLVSQELAAQEAIKKGLDADPDYQAGLARMQAQLDAFRRQELSALYRRHVKDEAKVTEEEVKRFYDENTARMQEEINVWQILTRDRDVLEKAKQDLAKGVPFETVAARQFPNLPKSVQKPWEVGYVRWNQIPKEWFPVIKDLPAGSVTGIIEGPRNRSWILKIIDRRKLPGVTLESERATITQVLQLEKSISAQTQMLKELREKASIKYEKPDK